jgi:hypothetical protein
VSLCTLDEPPDRFPRRVPVDNCANYGELASSLPSR